MDCRLFTLDANVDQGERWIGNPPRVSQIHGDVDSIMWGMNSVIVFERRAMGSATARYTQRDSPSR
jgi:hypothetical protein